MPTDSTGSRKWLLRPRLLRSLALVAGLAGLALPVAVVKWVSATTPLESQSDAGPLRPAMVVVPAGTYEIGSGTRVTLSRYAIAVTEVTQAQYERVVGENPSDEKECGPDCPVTDVTWLDAVRYVNQLSELDPEAEPCYEIDGEEVEWIEPCDGYRLPTEAEWEVAARATTDDRFAGTDDESEVCEFGNVGDASFQQANPGLQLGTFVCDDGFPELAPVRTFQPNGFHLYDMTGNVWEWVWDWYQPGDPMSGVDPRGPQSGLYRVYRGGSFDDGPQGARVALRGRNEPSNRYANLGFRVARSLPSSL